MRTWPGWLKLETTATPWGAEAVWAHTNEYAAKLLRVNSGHALSMQYHRDKCETLLCLAGLSLMLVDDDLRLMQPGDTTHVTSGTTHRIAAVTDTLLIEVSTPELGDVVRLQDEYGRIADLAASSGAHLNHAAVVPQRGPRGRNHRPTTAYRTPMAKDHRLANIAIMLASGQRLRASELAERFRVSERTVYRDMQRLSLQGFPLAAIPGPSGGFALYATASGRGIHLELDEAVTLAIGAALAARVLYREDNGAARRALQKIQDSMPDTIACALPDLLDLFGDSPVRRALRGKP